jgi:hypothetical protein
MVREVLGTVLSVYVVFRDFRVRTSADGDFVMMGGSVDVERLGWDEMSDGETRE